MDVERIWLKSYPVGVPSTIDPDTIPSLVSIVDRCVSDYAERPAFSNFGKVLTYRQIDQLSAQFASFLQHHVQMMKGERLAIMLPNCLQYPVALFAALRIGVCVVNVNPLYTVTELEHQLKDSGATAIIVLENFAHVLQKALAKTQIRQVVVTGLGDLLGPKGWIMNAVIRHVKKMVPAWSIEKALSFKQALSIGHQSTFEPVSVVGDDIAFLQYTGGTTGVSKGAVLTHRNMVSNLLQASSWINGAGSVQGIGGIITALPLYHVFSLTANCFTFFYLGAENILITNPRDLLGMIREMRRRPFFALTGVNTLFNGLLNTPEFSKLDFSNFKFTLGGGMAVQKAVALRWKKTTGVVLLEAYGLTETCPAVTINPLNLSEFNGSIGLPIPSTDVLILGDDDQPVPLGMPGELCVRGPQVMKGYWQRPEETADVIREGWLHTGDIATMDVNGFVRIVDRKKDMIIVSGLKVYPNEVEDVLAMHEAVKEVVVVGIPAQSGEMVKAYVVPRENVVVTPEELVQHCREHLTAYKVPKEIEFRADLPKTNVGKVLRRALRDDAIVKQQSQKNQGE